MIMMNWAMPSRWPAVEAGTDLLARARQIQESWESLLVGGALIDATSGSITIAAIGVGLLLVSLVFVPTRALRTASLVPRREA